MNAAAMKAGGVALIASPVDDMAVTMLLGRAAGPEFGPLLLALGLMVGAAVWWYS